MSTDELLELDMGEFAGKPRAEIYTKERLDEIGRDVWNFKPPGGESQREVEERVMRVIDEIKDTHESGVSLVVYHGLAIKCHVAPPARQPARDEQEDRDGELLDLPR